MTDTQHTQSQSSNGNIGAALDLKAIGAALDLKVAFIKKHCAPYLERAKESKLMLFRGIPSIHPDAEKDAESGLVMCTVNKKREPRGSLKEIHDFLNEIAFASTGVHLRSEGVFVSQCQTIAGVYGDVYQAIPMGDFQAHWMDGVRDAFVIFEAAMPMYEEKDTFIDIARCFVQWIANRKISPLLSCYIKDAFHDTTSKALLRLISPAVMGKESLNTYREFIDLLKEFFKCNNFFKNDPFTEKQKYNEEIILSGMDKYVIIPENEMHLLATRLY